MSLARRDRVVGLLGAAVGATAGWVLLLEVVQWLDFKNPVYVVTPPRVSRLMPRGMQPPASQPDNRDSIVVEYGRWNLSRKAPSPEVAGFVRHALPVISFVAPFAAVGLGAWCGVVAVRIFNRHAGKRFQYRT
ncbi:hypothetical protein [Fimbriiglobus ruber]|uniref:Uncharacterized protein n=1 Tax=Fimbriiglobus ruber TaxID=1908690 RepID=A0A225E8U6_9BACT|nr:hypothetical protein [Fimbriiglobus ruber]OWK45035.1 hypothetical protein FRUB_01366 [Fimbriiglobus ruber]